MFCPQVCSRAKKPISAPRCLGSQGDGGNVSAVVWKSRLWDGPRVLEGDFGGGSRNGKRDIAVLDGE